MSVMMLNIAMYEWNDEMQFSKDLEHANDRAGLQCDNYICYRLDFQKGRFDVEALS